jgi:hypothetical protein
MENNSLTNALIGNQPVDESRNKNQPRTHPKSLIESILNKMHVKGLKPNVETTDALNKLEE